MIYEMNCFVAVSSSSCFFFPSSFIQSPMMLLLLLLFRSPFCLAFVVVVDEMYIWFRGNKEPDEFAHRRRNRLFGRSCA